ncbi:MAG: hypothetical protein IJS84_06260 [Spirochaetales bacterium]|nr:hypothetical protein [Spirochaetales bacterium]
MKGTIDIEKKVMEVIRQMTGGNGVSIVYESFEGYEVPPRTQFAMLNKPAVSIKDGRMTFNMACVRIFKGIHHIVPMINRKTHRLAIIPCKEEEGSSVQWSRMKGEELVNKDITARDFIGNIYSLMGWDEGCRYKIMGRLSNSERGLIFVFDLDEAIKYEAIKGSINKKTGKPRIEQIKYYPEKYRDRIGRDYSDYMEARRQEGKEALVDYDTSQEESAVIVSEVPTELVEPIIKEAADEVQQQLPGMLAEDA